MLEVYRVAIVGVLAFINLTITGVIIVGEMKNRNMEKVGAAWLFLSVTISIINVANFLSTIFRAML